MVMRVMTTLPAAPLRELACHRAGDYWQSLDDPARNGYRTLRFNKAEQGANLMLRHYAFRYGITHRQANRDYQDLQRETVNIRVADRFCTFLGIHPIALWPYEWPVWDPDPMIVGVL